MGREQCGERAMGITQGKMEQEWLLVSLLYQFLGVSMPENKYMEIVKALVVLLAPDAPSDTSLCTCP